MHEIIVLIQGSLLRTLNPFLDDDVLLRLQRLLEQASICLSKHTIIIPSGHIAKLLICLQHNFLKHAGVSILITTLRSCYWIVGLRKLAKTVCSECIIVVDMIPELACSQ